MRPHKKFAPRLESLDDRAMMSVTLTGGLLEVVGTTGVDQIRVTLPTPQTLQVTVDTTGESRQFDLSAVNSILVRALAGNDFVLIGPTVTLHAEVRGWAGNDTELGGAGADTLLGGGGNDYVQGRGGNDTLLGQAGDDYLVGQGGDDTLDGQLGNDLLSGGSGTNTLNNGTNVDLTFTIPVPGGFGTISLTNDTPGNVLAKTFTVTATGAPPNASADVSIGGFALGRLTTNSAGNGQFVYHQNYDKNFDGLPDFLGGAPSTFPEITSDTVVTAHVISPIDQTFTATIGELMASGGV